MYVGWRIRRQRRSSYLCIWWGNWRRHQPARCRWFPRWERSSTTCRRPVRATPRHRRCSGATSTRPRTPARTGSRSRAPPPRPRRTRPTPAVIPARGVRCHGRRRRRRGTGRPLRSRWASAGCAGRGGRRSSTDSRAARGRASGRSSWPDSRWRLRRCPVCWPSCQWSAWAASSGHSRPAESDSLEPSQHARPRINKYVHLAFYAIAVISCHSLRGGIRRFFNYTACCQNWQNV